MLECNRYARKKITVLYRALALLFPFVCVGLLLTQTAFAKNTYLINDGGRVVIHTTYATDPAEVLDEAGLVLGTDDTYITQSGIGMSEITVQRKQTVTIVYSGNTLTATTYGETVESLLERMNISLSDGDVVSEALSATTSDGMVITVRQTVTQKETFTISTPYETHYCYDATLAEGEQVVLTQGVEGQVLCTANVHYVDGKEVSRTLLGQTVVSQRVDALIAIGTYEEAPDYSEIIYVEDETPATEPEEEEEVEEEVELPVIDGGVITTPDGEVLTYTGTMQAVATAYHSSDPGCTLYTATGTMCRVGAIAVDPRVIPYGTRMYIVTNDGQYVYGIAVAEDCGGSIKGARVDLYFDTVEECWDFGIRDCTIYFLG